MLLISSIALCALLFLYNFVRRRYVGVIFNVIWFYLLLVIKNNVPDLSSTTAGILLVMIGAFNLSYGLSQYINLKSIKPFFFHKNSIDDREYKRILVVLMRDYGVISDLKT